MIWYANDAVPTFPGQEAHLWDSYQRLRKHFTEYGEQASKLAQDVYTAWREPALHKKSFRTMLPKFDLRWFFDLKCTLCFLRLLNRALGGQLVRS
jgi:hypothetical protein